MFLRLHLCCGYFLLDLKTNALWNAIWSVGGGLILNLNMHRPQNSATFSVCMRHTNWKQRLKVQLKWQTAKVLFSCNKCSSFYFSHYKVLFLSAELPLSCGHCHVMLSHWCRLFPLLFLGCSSLIDTSRSLCSRTQHPVNPRIDSSDY